MSPAKPTHIPSVSSDGALPTGYTHHRNRSISAPLRIDLTDAAIVDTSGHARHTRDTQDTHSASADADAHAHRTASTSSSHHPKPEAPAITLPMQREAVRHFAMDLGGSLVKLVYFSPGGTDALGRRVAGGRLHFRKFPTSHLEDCMRFIEFKKLHLGGGGAGAGGGKAGGCCIRRARACVHVRVSSCMSVCKCVR